MSPDFASDASEIPFHLDPPPDATSIGRGWRGVTLNWHDAPAGGEAASPALDHDVVALRTAGCARLTQIRGGQTDVRNVARGHIAVHPRGMPSRWLWDQAGAVLLMRIPPGLLRDAALAMPGAPQTVELHNHFGLRDPFIERLGLQLLDELHSQEHASQAYITQALSMALAGHLVHRLGTHPAHAEHGRTRLHPRALQRVQDYIRANLHEHIDLQTLANLANVSRFHFARMFRESAGVSAMAYLESVRMLRAQELIRDGIFSLGQIASLTGYEDQSHFSKRFRLFCGLSPSAYARQAGCAAPAASASKSATAAGTSALL
ncbi:helix-turn-helix domain-containing protein [Duganella callida]|uniref:AraC family transcriptional regulator n=1 Tax=Duganella callida TaxID=2561932 RepID=A0A4Y9SRE8_9BURK|nr:AraC family transcriptional regulator [Duganella callida]TFW29372.1 AraC family transcriptional regulator [Duganella callida]